MAAAILVTAGLAAGCGGGGSNGGGTVTSPSPSPTATPAPGGGGSSNPTTATITIGGDGRVSPSSVTIAPGGRVTFVNSDNQAHDMSSDPHPEHTDCPEINQVGFLTAGQSRTTGNLNTARTCGFHDHNQPTNTALQGRIVIQ